MADGRERAHELAGTGEPRLLLREQSIAGAPAVLYVHGATFPSSCSLMLKFDGVSWADALNGAGLSAWALDFAGFGGSERYPDMNREAPGDGPPLGRADEAARQIFRAVRAISEISGAPKVSLVAHSWGTVAAGLFAGRHRDLVERLVFFGPIFGPRPMPAFDIPPWRFLTVAEQHARFVADVPPGHPPVLNERHFDAWTSAYLASDPTALRRAPPSVRTPNGPAADLAAIRRGETVYDPALIRAPLAIIRGEWDSLCLQKEAAELLSAASAPEKIDVEIPRGTHLMHLEESRGALYRAASDFLAGG